MSDEKHDQNRGTETPDTAPSFGRVIMLGFLTYVVVAVLAYFFLFQLGAAMETSAQNLETTPQAQSLLRSSYETAAYLAPPIDQILTSDQITYANFEPVGDAVELATLLGTYPEINVIYLDPRRIDDSFVSVLQQELRQGRTIVGLNMPHSELGDLLEIEPTLPDLLEDDTRDSVIWISLYQVRDDRPIELASTYDQFDQMLAITSDLSAR